MYTKHWYSYIFFDTLLFMIVYLLVKAVVTVLGMQFRMWIPRTAFVLICVGMGFGLLQLLVVGESVAGKIVAVILLVLMIMGLRIIIIFYAFTYGHDERKVVFDGRTCVERNYSFLDPEYRYYPYINEVICGSECLGVSYEWGGVKEDGAPSH